MFSLSTLMVSLFVCIFIVSVLVLTKAYPSRKRIEIRWLLFFTATVCLISFCSLSVYVQGSLQNKETFSRLRYLGFSLVGQTWFFFLYYTYGTRGFFHKAWVKGLSLAPAVVTWALVLVPPWHHLLTKNYRPFAWHGVTLVTFEGGGPLWLVHLIWSYFFVWLGIFYALYMILRVDNMKKKQLAVLSIGGLVAILVDFFSLNYFPGFRWAMLSSGATFITESAILYGIVRHDLLSLPIAAKDQTFLLSMIAHDFSDALQTQNQLSKNLLNLGKEAELQKCASTLAESTSASQDFMTNVLLWARSQENQFQPIVRPYEMNVLLKEVVNNLESIWKIHDLQVDIRSDHDPLILNGDSVMIESVVRNLLTNAIRASLPGQKINLCIESGLKEIKVLVQDEGAGMSLKQLEAIRQNSGTAFSDSELRPNGFGLGLAIARRFVDLHKGRLHFFSEEGKGTLVTLTLPL